MSRCAGCKSRNFVVSDCRKYLKCGNCKQMYNTHCNHCGSYNLGTVGDDGDSSQQCKDCGICSAMYEMIPYDKPKFNGVYDENNSSQFLMDTLNNIHEAMNREPTWFDKLKIYVRNMFLPVNDCRRFM